MSKQKSKEHVSKNNQSRADGDDTNQVSRTQDVKAARTKKLSTQLYEKELKKLHIELVQLQEWIRHKGLRVVVVFEGRDAAGKGGAIKRITEPLNPRFCRVVALNAPTERELTQWYFQRYVPYLPAAGEMVLFDRSWYNRAGIERVMEFCSDEEYNEFARSCPEFERMLIRSGIILIKYWFSISDAEQQRRFHRRLNTPTKHWKLSPMDLESIARWEDYSRAKDDMFGFSDIPEAPWHVVHADDKKRARLNCISHLLSLIAYDSVPKPPLELPERPQEKSDYTRPPLTDQRFVPERY
jgi:polyphosphate kinase 2